MSKYWLYPIALLMSNPLYAGIVSHFKDERGKTDWQHVANWSSGILILLLSITAVTLFFSRRQTRRSNEELNTIRRELEQRVKERTATLDESNRLLQESNQLLLGEISEHKSTTGRLRSSEAYIRDILSSMPLMLIGIKEDGTITQWNQSAERITGIKALDAIQKNLWTIYPTITMNKAQVAQAIEQKRTVVIKHSQRGQYHFDITIYPLRDQVDTGVVILIDDVTQQIQTANMLIQRDKMSSMGELASSMAHDINAPLQRILGQLKEASRLCEQGDFPAERTSLQTLLDKADMEGNQAVAVINNLLNFSASPGGKKSQAQLTNIVDHTLSLANDVLSEPSGLRFRDIHIEKDYAENLPDAPCYVSELQQVFLSLFRHACWSLGQVDQRDFSPLIRIEIMECYDMLWVKVQHNGVGLDSEEQQYLFEPFFNSHTQGVTASNYEADKRLSFSHFIITEQHRGQLAVTSDPKVGTTFHLQLPLE